MISVIMTVYNIEEYLQKAISSVLNQTYKDLELIIVNDCTIDNSMSVVSLFNDNRIRVINHSKNLGAGLARRTGIEAAKGEYVITIDGDDWIAEDFLEKLYNKAIETDADITGAGITYVFPKKSSQIFLYEEKISKGMDKFRDYNDGRIIFLNNKLIKRHLYDKVQYSARRYVEDTPTIIPLMYYANKIAYVKHAGYFYNMRETSLTHTTDVAKDNLFKALCAKDCIEFFKDKEPEYRNLVPLSQMLEHVKVLKDLNLTQKDFKKYQEEYNELFKYILGLIEF